MLEHDLRSATRAAGLTTMPRLGLRRSRNVRDEPGQERRTMAQGAGWVACPHDAKGRVGMLGVHADPPCRGRTPTWASIPHARQVFRAMLLAFAETVP